MHYMTVDVTDNDYNPHLIRFYMQHVVRLPTCPSSQPKAPALGRGSAVRAWDASLPNLRLMLPAEYACGVCRMRV